MALSRPTRVPLLPASALLGMIATLLVAPLAAEPGAPSYVSDVAPILARNCVGCHSESTKMGGLVLETFGSLEQGGQRGPALVPGDSGQSLLYLMVTGKIEPQMPLSADPLGPAEVELLGRWIDAGAPGPGPGEVPMAAHSGQLPRIDPIAPVPAQVFSVHFHPDGGLLATGRHGGVAVVDTLSGEVVADFDGLADIARAVAFSPGGQFLAAGGGHPQQQGEVRIWRFPERRLETTLRGHLDTIQALAFSPDGQTLATASYDKDIKLWDVASGMELRTLRDHIDAVYALAYTPTGELLLSGSADRSVKVWNPATGERRYTLGEPIDGINSIAIHPAGDRVAAGGYDRTIRVWKLGADSGDLLNVLIAHQSPILRIAFSPDGAKIATAAADRTLKFFDAETLDELATLDGQPDWVMSLDFSPDGSRVAAGRFDGSLSIYDSETYRDQLGIVETARNDQ